MLRRSASLGAMTQGQTFTRQLRQSVYSMVRHSSTAAAPTRPSGHDERRGACEAIDQVLARRARAGKLVAGVAAASDSDMFKGPGHPRANTHGGDLKQNDKPKALRWDGHLSPESLSRKPCTLKQAAKHLKKPGIISLGGGLPAGEHFPFAELAFKAPTAAPFSNQHVKDVTIEKYDSRHQDGAYDLSTALNYSQSTGSAQMMRFITEHTEIVHAPPYADWRVCQTIGSTGALEQALRMFCDKDRGDSVLTEEFSFSTALETIAPLGIKAFGVAMDEQGLRAEVMDQTLTEWNQDKRGARKPHVLYTVPCGQNPTGATQGLERRKAIYRVAQKHDMFILEDDPYYFLQMQRYVGRGNDSSSSSSEQTGSSHQASSSAAGAEQFLSSLLPSLVRMDVDGRVLRMDSFSKVVAPGSRAGWVVGSEQVIERYQRHAEVASQGPSGFSQVILHKLLDDTWGHQGYLEWLMHLGRAYTSKRNALLAACEDHLPRDIVSWEAPEAGMFMWLKVDYTQHPRAGQQSLDEVEQEIFDACIHGGVLVARGSWFVTDKAQGARGLFFRATFAAASVSAMNEAITRFGKAVRGSFGRQ